ncbi:MAG: DUF6464 family protein [Jaaginema sp. PMC 1079.18]|nr:DUF6464 family protein [Jaaginema sp. PMC 1080.18]MEC4852038.1 DUF6464 family protein [Jaaginema sp. PMC 1079.18]MEC4867594.1 DUF6464 family protein [Jaaginema sp. PMC 1078.18]
MLTIIGIFSLALLSLLLSGLGLRKAHQQWQNQLQQILARNDDWGRSHSPIPPPTPVGDRHCLYNARSTHLRCAVNPGGPCEGCPDFQPRTPLNPDNLKF